MKKQSYFTGELGQRFSFRKYLGVGLCSVALGTMFLTANNHQVKADAINDGDATSSAVNASAKSDDSASAQYASVVKETAPFQTQNNAGQSANQNTDQTSSANQTKQAAIQAPVANKSAVSANTKVNAPAQNTQAAQPVQNKVQTPVANTTNASADNGSTQSFAPKKVSQTISSRQFAVLAVDSNSNPNQSVHSHQTVTNKFVINYHYANDNDPKEDGYIVDQAHKGQEYKASETFDVNISYDSDFDAKTGKTILSNIQLTPVNAPNDLGVKIATNDKNQSLLTFSYDFYKGNTDSVGTPVDYYKYGVIVRQNSANEGQAPTSQINKAFANTGLNSSYPLSPVVPGGSLTYDKTGSAAFHNSTFTLDVLYYKRPYKITAQYQDGDSKNAVKVGTPQDWGTIYYDTPLAKKLASPDDRYDLIQKDKTDANISMNDQGAITNDNPNILNPTLDQDNNGVGLVTLPIELQEKWVPYDHNSKTYPPKFSEKDFDETIGRKIITKGNPNGDTTTPQETHVYRTGRYNLVTHEMQFNDDWTDSKLPSYTAPVVKGYTADIPFVSDLPVHHGDKPNDVVITYTKDPVNSVSKGFQLVDADNNDAPVGKKQMITDVPGTTHNVKLEIPENYELKKGVTIPATYTLKDGDSGTLTYEVVHKHQDVTNTDEGAKKDVTRTIVVTDPQGNVTKTPQTAHFTRHADKDLVTGNVTYGEWSSPATLPKFDVPQIKNYDSYIKGEDGKTNKGVTVDPKTVSATDKDSEVDVNYQPIQASTDIVYVDKDNNNKPVKTDKVTGDQGKETPLTPQPPKGYEIVPGTKIPGKVTIGQDPIQIPVQKQDVNQDIHYVYTDPKDPNHTKQVVGKVTVTGKPDTKTPFDPVKNTPEGYKLKDPKNAPTQITITDNDTPVEIPVDKIKQGQTVNYIDPKDNNKVIKNDTIPGEEGKKVPFTPDLPDGWVIVPGTDVPKNIIIDPDKPLNIPIEHGQVQIDKPMNKGDIVPGTKGNKMDQDITDSDLNKQITRTIVMNMPDGNTKDEVQVVTAHRSAIVDQVTGKIIKYTPYTANKGGYDEYVVPDVKGYTPTQKTVPAEKVDPNTAEDEVVVINYKKNPENSNNGKPDNGNNGGVITPSTPVTPQQPSAPTQPTTPSQPTQASETTPDEDKTIPEEAFQFAGDKGKGHTTDNGNNGGNGSNGGYNGPIANNGGAGQIVSTPATISAPAIGSASEVDASPASAAQAVAPQAQTGSLPQTGSVQSMAVIALGMALMGLSVGSVVLGKRKED